MSLTIVTVVEDAPDLIQPREKRTRYGTGVAPESYIESLVQRWTGVGPSVDGEVVRDPISAAGGIRAHLAERPAGLVAVTTHARSGLQRALLGAQAASIVRASVAPCLVAPVAP
jgi:nucleotide-binding universal stress UspA family protein